MNVKKLLGLAAAALIVWWVISDPHGAAAFAHKSGTFIAQAAHSFATFFASL